MGKTGLLPEHERLLEGVHIASAGNALGLPLASVDLRSRQSMAQQALRWTYVLRSRQRWVRDAKVREQHQLDARDTLRTLGLGDDGLRALGQAPALVVRVPYRHEALCWEGRIFPWEYVLAAATREQRRGATERPTPLTVIRELQLQHEVEGEWWPVPREAVVMPAWQALRVLFVSTLPTELGERWTVEAELKNLAAALPPEVPSPRVLNYPSLDELVAELKARPPHLLHFAGMDSHQGLRELGALLGKAALVEAPESDEAGAPGRQQLIDELLADSRRLPDGLLLRGSAGYPRLVHAQALARAVADAVGTAPPYLTTLNVWNSAARLAPMLIAEGATRAALGFQDAFDDSLAEYALVQLLRHLFASGFDLPAAFGRAWEEVRALPESVDATGVTLWLDGPVFVDPATRAAHAAEGRALAAAAAEVAAPAPASPEVRCAIEPFPELNYAVLHNAQPLFKRFVLSCDAPAEAEPLDVEVAVHMGDEEARFERRVVMQHERENLTKDIHVPLTADVARGVHEAINTSLQVRVSQGGRLLYHDSHRLRLLPVDQWRDNRRDGQWLPSFVLPRDPAVVRAVSQSQRYNRVLRDDPTAGFEGYQCVPDGAVVADGRIDEELLRGVDRQVEAIWATLLHDWQLGYVNPPPSYSRQLDSQRLRMPSTVLADRAGTCIDLALLFAACLELVDIYPVVFLLEGHALPGWWRHPSFRDAYMQMTGSYSGAVQADAGGSSAANAQTVPWHAGRASWDEVRQLIAERKLVPIETVRLTEHCGFVEAIEAGVDALNDRADYDSMLDIITARQRQITPLPLLRDAP
ncbi:hypothetical protein [Roseateles saccharophilus]|uniref:Transglutaminase superfamily protein n=1 Tax=Roseateles saccharophilus TaxID=304 RepID=A0A4R3UMT8_ROSSA|nr:hypothetical protein [Roseateles saccharophilus]MDG0834270.1 hypothetical protein [Roseateles saccharophilus]TCU91880.1 hypothetical protein EV671_102448 [Roseateles saccharophilus]